MRRKLWRNGKVIHRPKEIESVIFLKTQELNEMELLKGAQLIQEGEIVAFPTDTVYGLGADATNNEAVEKIFAAKGRPTDRPISVLIANYKDIEKYALDVPPEVFKLAEKFWPGPLTIILKNAGLFAPAVTPSKTTVGLRMPDHPLTLDFIKKCGRPLATPSANSTGRPSPTLATHVLDDLVGKIAAVIDGGETSFGIESTVLDYSNPNHPLILRPGNITKEAIEATIQKKIFKKKETPSQTKSSNKSEKHYEPKIPVFVVESSWDEAIEKMTAQNEKVAILANKSIIEDYQAKATSVFSLGEAEDLETANRNLFQGLRTLELSQATVILAEPYTKGELSIPYMNRLQNAANKKSI